MMGSGSYREALVLDAHHTGGSHPPDLLSILHLAFDFHWWGHGVINPFASSPGEVLLLGFFRNYEGLLICDEGPLTLSGAKGDVLAREVEFLQQHVVISYFAEGNLSPAVEFRWLANLRRKVAPSQVLFHRPAGSGFFYIWIDWAATTQKILMLIPYQFQGGMTIYQPWIKAFNPLQPLGVLIPTWITLKNLPLEYFKFSHKIGGAVGQVLGEEDSSR
jgi:hypothetical protein